MYAIIETGGKQYKVGAGDVIRVEKLPEAEGAKIKFDKVLAVNDGAGTQFGTPYLDAAVVNATVTLNGKGEKVIVYKFKAKKDYRRKQGHRQPFTELEIESLTLGGKTIFKYEAPKKEEKPAKKADSEEADVAAADADEVKAEVADAGAVKAGAVKGGKKPVAEDDAESTKADAASEAAEAEAREDEAEADAADAPEKDSEEAGSADDKTTEAESGEDKAEAAAADAPEKVSKEEKPADAKPGNAKLKKADIMAKLDELGAEYPKSAKKDELLAILEEAESK